MALSPFQQGALGALKILRDQIIADRALIETQTYQDHSEIDVIAELIDKMIAFYEAFDEE